MHSTPTIEQEEGQPGTINWTPLMEEGRGGNFYNNGVFDGRLTNAKNRKASAALSARVPDAPPTAPYRAKAEIGLLSHYPRFDEVKNAVTYMPQAFLGNTDDFNALNDYAYAPRDTELRMDIAVWGDANGNIARRVTNFENDHFSRAMNAYRQHNSSYTNEEEAERDHQFIEKRTGVMRGALPASMDETFVGGTLRHVAVQSVDPARSGEKYFDENGGLHRDGGKPAVIMRHAGGELLEYYENGKPHCLTGPYRQGYEEGIVTKPADEDTRAPVLRAPASPVKPEYAIHGKKMSEAEFYRHPDVIAARAQQGAFSRIGNWFESKFQGYQDDGTDLADLRRMDTPSQLGIFLGGLEPDIRRATIGNLAGMFPDHPRAKALNEKRLGDYPALATRLDAAEKLLGASAHADGVTRDISRTRDELGKLGLDDVTDALDLTIGGVVESKTDNATHLTRADKLIHGDAAFKKECAAAFDTAHGLLGTANLPGTKTASSATPIVEELERQHARLPDPRIEADAFVAATGNITSAADDAMNGMPDQMAKLMEVAAIAGRYLDTKYNPEQNLRPAEDPVPEPKRRRAARTAPE